MSDPATPYMREQVHAVLDPIWQNAAQTGGYSPSQIRKYSSGPGAYYLKQSARSRVYMWLAAQMHLTRDECHAAKFTAEQCREAIELLSEITFYDVRKWARRSGIKVRRHYDMPPREDRDACGL